jgi:integrase
MPRKPKKERVPGQYFVWLLGTRNGVFYADGRSNTHDLGRHSLGTCDRNEALDQLRHLDLVKAVEVGLADDSLLKAARNNLLSLEDGRQRYMEYVARPAIQGGASPGTAKRYKAVFDKFAEFAAGAGIRYWQQVSKDVLGRYGKWLEDRDYHDKTQYIELTVLKQALKWMVGEELLPPTSNFRLPLKKPTGTSTYCYTQDQVRAIVAHCRADEELHWLADVVVALGVTGLRIGELAELQWPDIDLEKGVIRLTDTTRRTRKSKRQEARTTKSHRDRTLPIHPELRAILVRLPQLPDNRVFHGPHGGKIKPDTVRNVLRRDVLTPLAAKFPTGRDTPGITSGRLHSFRHFFCSTSADSGVPEQMLMSWLGHRASEMIRHYYHMRQEEARKQMSRLPLLGPPAGESTANREGQG